MCYASWLMQLHWTQVKVGTLLVTAARGGCLTHYVWILPRHQPPQLPAWQDLSGAHPAAPLDTGVHLVGLWVQHPPLEVHHGSIESVMIRRRQGSLGMGVPTVMGSEVGRQTFLRDCSMSTPRSLRHTVDCGEAL